MKACGVILQLLLLLLVAAPLSAETWFVRPDGGTRYSAKVHSGQCDGKADAAYPGKGANQHCAFNDVRYMWMDGTYGNSQWVINGGDTLVIRGCAAQPWQANPSNPNCRIGWDIPNGQKNIGSLYFWCAGVADCSMPPPPSGTAVAHTRILGACAYDGNCKPVIGFPYSGNLTQLFGGMNVGTVIELMGSSYVDVEGLEITTHNGACTRVGAPQVPAGCRTSAPVSDFASQGIQTNNASSNVTLQDVYIHGMNSDGIFGPIGGPFTLNRVSISFNTFAGWNFDDGRSTPDAPGSSIAASYVTMEGNGCLEEYPIAHPSFPALSCWDIGSSGFGDSWSGQDATLASFVCDHCVMAYNTKDGFIGPHTMIVNLKITNSQSYGNMGQQWKWGGAPNSTTIFENNLTVGNCDRMTEPMPGARPDYNKNLREFCRAGGDIFSFYTATHSTVMFASNSSVGYSSTMFDLNCQRPNDCATAHIVFRNNVTVGFLNPRQKDETPGIFYYSDPTLKIEQDHNLFFNMRSKPCPLFGRPDLLCVSPGFYDQTSATLANEGQLDHFNFHLQHGSPATGHGQAVEGITTDFFGVPRPNPPSIGAAEPNK